MEIIQKNNKKGVKAIKKLLSILMLSTLLMPNYTYATDYILAGKDRFETAIEISKNWNTSKEIVIANSTASSDVLCATVLASQLDCPILLTNKNNLDNNTLKEIKRLNPKKAYIVGGIDVLDEKINKQLEENKIDTKRISGIDRYKTSLEVAKAIKETKNIKTVAIVNGENTLSDAVSIAPISGQKSMPIILSKEKELGKAKEFIKYNNIEKSYIIGGHDAISEEVEKEIPNSERVYGKNRYETNAKVIDRFYKNKIDKLFYCKGSYIKENEDKVDLVDAMLVSPLASKKESPILLVGEKIEEEQKKAIKNRNIKSLVQVGHGVDEIAKQELEYIQNNYRPIIPIKPDKPIVSTPPKYPSKPVEPEIPKPPTDIDKPADPETTIDTNAPKYVKHTVDDNKIISIIFDEDIYTDIEELKKNIKIGIDKEYIKSEKNIDKYINLSQYDEVEVKDNNLIIKLDNELIENSSLKLEGGLLKDEYENTIKEAIQIDNLKGVNIKLAFVNNSIEFIRYVADNDVNLIKLENDIKLDLNTIDRIDINKNIIIDGAKPLINKETTNLSKDTEGSVENKNYTLQLSEYNLSSQVIPINIMRNRDTNSIITNIEIKNLNLSGITVQIIDNKNVSLENLYIDVSKKDAHCISITEGIVKMKDIDLISKTAGVKIKPGIVKINKSKVLLDGYVYNNYKINNDINSENENDIKDESTYNQEENEEKYAPSIIVESKIINEEEVSKENVVSENINIEEMYNYKYTYDNEENKTKKIENYYKK